MKKTLILLAMVAALMILPFFINHGGEFGGSDGEAESQIRCGGAGLSTPGSSRYMNRRAARLRVCCLPCRARWARR